MTGAANILFNYLVPPLKNILSVQANGVICGVIKRLPVCNKPTKHVFFLIIGAWKASEQIFRYYPRTVETFQQTISSE